MPETEVKKSKLENSPIITKSPNTKVFYGSDKKSGNQRPWLKYVWNPIIAPIIVVLIVGLTKHYMTNDDTKSDATSPEILIEDSNLQNSPVFNKSPGSKVDYNLTADNLIFADNDSIYKAMGVKDPLGLYIGDKKVGTVVNPTINEAEKTFVF